MFTYVSKHIVIVLNLNLHGITFTHQSFTNTQYNRQDYNSKNVNGNLKIPKYKIQYIVIEI